MSLHMRFILHVHWFFLRVCVLVYCLAFLCVGVSVCACSCACDCFCVCVCLNVFLCMYLCVLIKYPGAKFWLLLRELEIPNPFMFACGIMMLGSTDFHVYP